MRARAAQAEGFELEIATDPMGMTRVDTCFSRGFRMRFDRAQGAYAKDKYSARWLFKTCERDVVTQVF